MKTTHLTPRGMRSRGEKSITWARTIPQKGVSDGITYHLARRDLHGKIVRASLTFFRAHTRSQIARSLWAARKGLRESVDARDLVILGLAEAVAA
jgi:hypothetical protein